MLRVRKPALDFDEVTPIWAATAELSHFWNTNSLLAEKFEAFLINGIRQIERVADAPIRARLYSETGDFLRQEAVHLKFHAEFNARVSNGGARDAAAAYERELAGILAHRTPAFISGYILAVETIGVISAITFFEHEKELFAKADQQAVKLWRWHLAEEYEHRAVPRATFNIVMSGKPGPVQYFHRVRMLLWARGHLAKHIAGTFGALMAPERADWDSDNLRASSTRERHLKKWMSTAARPFFVRALLPGFNIATALSIRDADRFLAET